MRSENSGMLEKRYVQALKYLVLEICSHLFIISPPMVFLGSLAEEAILICFNAAAFLHKSNSSVFCSSFAAITSLMSLK